MSKKTISRIGEWTVLTVCWGIILYVAGKGLWYLAWALEEFFPLLGLDCLQGNGLLIAVTKMIDGKKLLVSKK